MKPLSRCLVLSALLSASAVTPALADDGVGLSEDGRTWSSAIEAPLLDGPARWVPGDSGSLRFYIRNQGGSAGTLTLDVLGASADGSADSGDLQVDATVDGRSMHASPTQRSDRLLLEPDIADDSVVPVVVTVALPWEATNVTQDRSTSLRLRVGLTESVPAASGRASDDGGLLPGTGGIQRWIPLLGALLAGTGLAVVARSRRHEEVSTDV